MHGGAGKDKSGNVADTLPPFRQCRLPRASARKSCKTGSPLLPLSQCVVNPLQLGHNAVHSPNLVPKNLSIGIDAAAIEADAGEGVVHTRKRMSALGVCVQRRRFPRPPPLDKGNLNEMPENCLSLASNVDKQAARREARLPSMTRTELAGLFSGRSVRVSNQRRK